MTYVVVSLFLGASLAIVIQGLKFFGVPLEGKRNLVRCIVAVAALALAYVSLRGQPELILEDVLASAVVITTAAETAYRWVLSYVNPNNDVPIEPEAEGE